MTNFEIAALVRIAMLLCGVFVILIGAALVWKFGVAASDSEVKFSAGKLASVEFRQVSAGILVIGFGALLMIVAIQKPLVSRHTTGSDEVAAIRAPIEDYTAGSPMEQEAE